MPVHTSMFCPPFSDRKRCSTYRIFVCYNMSAPMAEWLCSRLWREAREFNARPHLNVLPAFFRSEEVQYISHFCVLQYERTHGRVVVFSPLARSPRVQCPSTPQCFARLFQIGRGAVHIAFLCVTI